FMTSWERRVRPVPRHRELLEKRGSASQRIAPERFSEAELRDLQVLFPLAWMGFSARKEEPVVAALVAKGRDYTEADKRALYEAQQRILASVMPLWKTLADRGQVELSTTPYYHPILPLLCDSDSARRAMPDTALPPRFAHPED